MTDHHAETDGVVQTEALSAVVEGLVIAMMEDISSLYRARAAAEGPGSPAASFNADVARRIDGIFRYADLRAARASSEPSPSASRKKAGADC